MGEEVLLSISSKFNKNGYVSSPISYERILETRPDARKGLQNFLIDCKKTFKDFSHHMGEDKNLNTAENKAIRDYNGDKCRVTDYVRAKTTVTSSDTIRALLSRDFEHLMYEHGIEVAGMNNYFAEPKDQTGYRCINLKLAIPVGTNRDTETMDYHIVELQVVAAQIEKVYKESHTYKRRAEKASDEIQELMNEHEGIRELKIRDITEGDLTPEETIKLKTFNAMVKPLRRISKLNYGACRLINGKAARSEIPNENYEALLDEKSKHKHILSPGKEEHLKSMKFSADQDAYLNEN